MKMTMTWKPFYTGIQYIFTFKSGPLTCDKFVIFQHALFNSTVVYSWVKSAYWSQTIPQIYLGPRAPVILSEGPAGLQTTNIKGRAPYNQMPQKLPV